MFGVRNFVSNGPWLISFAHLCSKVTAEFYRFPIILLYLLLIMSPSLVHPEIVEDPANEIVIENGNVTFLCNANGVPYPTIYWTFNTGRLPPLSQTNPSGKLSLSLVKNTAEYEGNYTCMAVNRAGIYNSTATLTVDGKFCNTLTPSRYSFLHPRKSEVIDTILSSLFHFPVIVLVGRNCLNINTIRSWSISLF